MSFLEKITLSDDQQETVLSALRNSKKKTVIYGASVYAYVLFKYLIAEGISVSAFVVDKAYKQGDKYMGTNVYLMEDIITGVSEYNICIGVANYPVIIEKFGKMDISGLVVIDVPDFLNIPNAFMDHEFVRTHQEEFQRAYDLFEDELSRETFIAAINTKISKDLRFISPFVRLDHLYFATSEFPISDNETLLDIGGFNGDTIRDFHQITKGKYNEIISLEPLPKIYRQLLNTIESLGITEKCTPLQIGAWHEKALLSFSNTDMEIDSKILIGAEDTIDVDTIDSILKKLGVSVSLIKMDINGAEFNALMGAEKTIQEDKPNIAVKMHVKEDFYRIPILLKKIAPEMKVYLRQRNYMSMMLVLYGTFRDINKTELN